MNFLLGSTGLVGSLLVDELKNKKISFLAINRRKVDYLSSDQQIIINEINDFDFLDVDKSYISLGYPLKWNDLIFMKKNIKKLFYEVDFELVLKLAKKLRMNGCHTLAIVSAVGANKSSKNFYLSIKGKLEEELRSMGFSKLIFARPGHLLGKRDKPRDFGTFLIEVFGKISDPFLLGKLKKFRNIQAEKVAELLIKATSEEFEDDDYVIEFDEIKKLT